ncbi:MAG: hypothetical protein GX442_19670 [Candidatus Riflebacteria bacterium]|nr:hypothetical protein [Candidatus Riflebacteria bacterium]
MALEVHHRNPRLERWEERLNRMFDQVDHVLEERYAGRFRLKPSRPPHGEGVTRDADGLFDLGISFSAGLTSQNGPGYVFQVRLATTDPVPTAFRQQIETEVADLVNRELPRFFPGLDLRLAREGQAFRLFGDLSLDADLPPLPTDLA